MNQGKYVFSQIMDEVVRYQFNQCVNRYNGNYRAKNFSCWEHFSAMSFGQLSFQPSLRGITVCLNAHKDKLYHLGFNSGVARNTLSNANKKRDWRIYRDYAEILIAQASSLYAGEKVIDLDLSNSVYVIDSSTIELCLNIFPWARLIKKRAAVKLNLGLNLAGNIPSFFDFSNGKEHDIHFLDRIVFEPGAYYVMDRGYLDFKRLYWINQVRAFFVIRAKDNMSFRRLYSHQIDKNTGVRCDQTIVLTGYYPKKYYPDKLRRIKYFDKETNRYYAYLTNNFQVDSYTIAELYKNRWQIELFFKWIKQHLRIKVFWGRSENAVKTQICIALCSFLLVAIFKKKRRINRKSYEILQILSVSLFDKVPLTKLILETELQISENEDGKQAKLWGF